MSSHYSGTTHTVAKIPVVVKYSLFNSSNVPQEKLELEILNAVKSANASKPCVLVFQGDPDFSFIDCMASSSKATLAAMEVLIAEGRFDANAQLKVESDNAVDRANKMFSHASPMSFAHLTGFNMLSRLVVSGYIRRGESFNASASSRRTFVEALIADARSRTPSSPGAAAFVTKDFCMSLLKTHEVLLNLPVTLPEGGVSRLGRAAKEAIEQCRLVKNLLSLDEPRSKLVEELTRRLTPFEATAKVAGAPKAKVPKTTLPKDILKSRQTALIAAVTGGDELIFNAVIGAGGFNPSDFDFRQTKTDATVRSHLMVLEAKNPVLAGKMFDALVASGMSVIANPEAPNPFEAWSKVEKDGVLAEKVVNAIKAEAVLKGIPTSLLADLATEAKRALSAKADYDR